jgi:DNA-binding beta-propeller fold protein YncE
LPSQDGVRRFRYIYVGHIGDASTLARPSGVAVDQLCGDVYVSDYDASRVLRFDAQGKLVGTIGHTGTDQGGLRGPVGVFLSTPSVPPVNPEGPPPPCGGVSTISKRVWIADRGANRVSIFGTDGQWQGGWCYWQAPQQPDGCSVREGADLDFYPDDVWVTDSLVYVAGGNADRVSEYDRAGKLRRTTVAGPAGSGVAAVADQLWSVRYDVSRLGLFSLDPAKPTIELVHEFGSGKFDPRTHGSFASPFAVAVGPNGRVYVDDAYRVQVFTPSGRYLSTIELPGGAVDSVPGQGVAVRYDGTVYVARGALHRVDVFSPGPLVTLTLKRLPVGTIVRPGQSTSGTATGPNAIEFTGTVWPPRPHDAIEIQEISKGFKTIATGTLDSNSAFRIVWDAPQSERTYAFRAFFYDPHPYYANRASAIEQIALHN